MFVNPLKSLLHNIGVVAVGFGVAFLGRGIDALLGINAFQSPIAAIAGVPLLALGFFLRAWATWHFYQQRMKVIKLSPQQTLITTGPYRFSRNPLYLGGNVFIFFGASMMLGSPSALLITALHIPVVDLLLRREDNQLVQTFGEEWLLYKGHVRRWL